MAIALHTNYPGDTNAPTGDYPGGSFRDEADPILGTALMADMLNDMIGCRDAAMSAAGIGYDGAPDSASGSQFLTALKTIIGGNSVKANINCDANGNWTLASGSVGISNVSQIDSWIQITVAPGRTMASLSDKTVLNVSCMRNDLGQFGSEVYPIVFKTGLGASSSNEFTVTVKFRDTAGNEVPVGDCKFATLSIIGTDL